MTTRNHCITYTLIFFAAENQRGSLIAAHSEPYRPRPGNGRFQRHDVQINLRRFKVAVAQQGSFLGYRVTVCDARSVFATSG